MAISIQTKMQMQLEPDFFLGMGFRVRILLAPTKPAGSQAFGGLGFRLGVQAQLDSTFGPKPRAL